MTTAEKLHHWNVKLLRVCGFSREAVLTSCIPILPACFGRKVRETVAVISTASVYKIDNVKKKTS